MPELRSPFKYTSRTFTTAMTDLNADRELVDKPSWFKRMCCGIIDLFSFILDGEANNVLLGTAFTRRRILEAARMLDYTATPRSTASGVLLFHLDAAVSFPLAIALDDLCAQTQGNVAVSARRFEARVAYSQASQTAETFTASAGDDWLVVARDYTTGEKVRVSTTGTLPGGLAAATDYYVIRVDATHIRLAENQDKSFDNDYIDITTAGSGTHTVTLFSIQVTCYQQTSKDQFVLGQGDNVTEWQEMTAPDQYILRDTVVIVINSITWTRVDTLIDSGAADTHYRIDYNSDGTMVVIFGDGTYGSLPGDFPVYISYAVGGGVDSNVALEDTVTIYAGADSNITDVTNSAALTGGADAEGDASIKRNAPLLLKARDRFVTEEDGEGLVLNYGGISLVDVTANYYGTLSARVLGIATGGGNPSSALKTAIQTYLIGRSVCESMDVRFVDSTITSVAVTAQIKILAGYTFATVQAYTVLALRLLFTECGEEILLLYQDNGIENSVDWINDKWSTSFDSDDYNQIAELLDNLDARDFDKDVQESDVTGYVDSRVWGVDYMTISVPSFPVSMADDEITTEGTMTVTQIP
jgi:hypothetical protein